MTVKCNVIGKVELVPTAVGFWISVFLVMDVVLFFLILCFCATAITLLPGTVVLDFLWEPALPDPFHKVWVERIPAMSIWPWCVCSVGCAPHRGVQRPRNFGRISALTSLLPIFFCTHCASRPTSEPSCLLFPSLGLLFPQTATWLYLALHSGLCSNGNSQRDFPWSFS